MDLITYQPQGNEEITEKLTDLLADYQLYHRNVNQILWDQKLQGYLDFNQKVNFLYQISHNNTHEIAKQLMNMGSSPSVEAIDPLGLQKRSVHALAKPQNFEDAIFGIIRISQQLLHTVQDVFYVAAEYEERKTMQMMGKYVWQLRLTIAIFSQVRMAQMN